MDRHEINYSFLMQAYIINFIYFIIFLTIYRKYSIGYLFDHQFIKNKTLFYILTISNIINISLLFQINIENYTFPFFGILNNLAKVFPFICLLYFFNRNIALKGYIIISVVIYFICIIGFGMRSLIVMPIFLIIFYSWKKNIVLKILILSFFTISFIPISGYFKSLRDQSKISESTFFISGLSEFIDEIHFRLNELNKISAGIVELIEIKGQVGANPLISSMQSIIPSFLFDNGKPWPGSVDGTSFGILARQAHDFVYDAIWNMSEYMYTLHPIWELGYLYFIFNILFTIVWILSIERISWRLGDKIGIIPICSFIPFTYSIVIQPLVIIFQTMAYITIPGIIFLIIYKFFINFPSYKIIKK
jgi:hypothetical protein